MRVLMRAFVVLCCFLGLFILLSGYGGYRHAIACRNGSAPPVECGGGS